MSAPSITITIAGPRQAGADCPHCGVEIEVADRIAACPVCARVHHAGCWMNRGGCGSYDCAPATRVFNGQPEASALAAESDARTVDDLFDDAGPKAASNSQSSQTLRITLDDLNRALLQNSPRSGGVGSRAMVSPGFAPQDDHRSTKASGWAMGSLATAIAGIPLFGIVTGFAAFIMGAVALAGRRPRQKGVGLAVAGMVLGLCDVAGWSYAMTRWLAPQARRMGAVNPRFVEAEVDLTKLSPAVARGMRANVLIEQKNGWSLGEHASGSGVILKIQDGKALIVTNRHVVDPKFSGDSQAGAASPPPSSIPSIDVTLLGQPAETGRVIWIAPDGIDLVLAEAACQSSEARSAEWRRGYYGQVGEPTFAIGNPYGFAWTHTQGSLSQYRTQRIGDRKIRVLQTQASLNPGNSGGGLYDKDGLLLGINTLTTDKRISEGIGFALSIEALWELSAPVPDGSRSGASASQGVQ